MHPRCLRRIISKKVRNSKYFCMKREQPPTSAGILVIGDEILKGEVQDTNSTFVAKQLHKLGLKLRKISVVPDDVKEISEEVRYFSRNFDYVLTTGGIGPTHDDVTYEGVALAFNEPMYLHPDLKNICSRFYRTTDPLGPGMKLAYVPKSSKLHYKTVSGGSLSYPNVSLRNVYMFPGIPELLKKTVMEAGPLLFQSTRRFFTKYFYCSLPEHKIVSELQQVVNEFPDVQFGCYPKMYHSIYKVKVTVESNSEKSTLRAYSRLLHLMPADSIVDIDDI